MSEKRILITGANGGMGRLCTDLAVKEGYALILADLAYEGLTEFAGQLQQQGVKADAYKLDVTDAESIAELITAIGDNGIDAVIHTVGISPQMAGWKKILDVDLVWTIKFMEAVRSVLNSGGAAVCFSSSSSYMSPPNPEIEQILNDATRDSFFDDLESLPQNPLENSGLAYSYGKKALRVYVEKQCFDWGAEGKRLVSLSPGLINTEMGQLEYKNTEHFAAMESRIAMKRLGEPVDIANTALFLVSDKAAYISGCDILVDGGLIASMGFST